MLKSVISGLKCASKQYNGATGCVYESDIVCLYFGATGSVYEGDSVCLHIYWCYMLCVFEGDNVHLYIGATVCRYMMVTVCAPMN